MSKEDGINEWRYTALSVLIFGIFDAVVGLSFLVLGLYPRKTTLIICIFFFLLFGFLSWRGYSLRVLLRILRCKVAGPYLADTPWWRRPQKSFHDIKK